MPIREEEYRTARETMDSSGVWDHKFQTEERVLDPVPSRRFEACWRREEQTLELQVYYFGRALDFVWDHVPFAVALYGKLLDYLGLTLYPERLLVEFVPEVNGWYVKATVPRAREVLPEVLALIVDAAG